jgi:hypothetical protein
MEAGDLLILTVYNPMEFGQISVVIKYELRNTYRWCPPKRKMMHWEIGVLTWKIASLWGLCLPGDPRNWEQTKYETAELNELGKKIIGLRKMVD